MIQIDNLIKKNSTLPMQIKASIWFLICSFMQKGISTITTPVFTRLLSAYEYGQYSVFNSWMSIITIFVTLNLSCGVYTQGLIKFEEERSIFSSSLQGLTVTLSAFWCLIYILFKEKWNQLFSLTTVQMLSMLALIWLTAVFGFWAAEQRVVYKYRMLVALTIVVSLAKPIVGILFVLYAQDKVTARILGLVIVEFVGYIGLFICQVRRGKRFFSFKYWKYAICFNIPLIPHYLSQTVLSNADRIMIKDMIGAEKAGIYSLAYSISLIMTLFNTSMMQTISPWIYKKIKDKNTNDIAPIAYVTMTLVAMVNILLIAFAPEIVKIFAPKSYYNAIYVIPPVAMSVFFMYCYDLFAKFAFYYEKTSFIMIASVGGAVMNIILNYIFINKYGYVAAGYTTLVCYILYAIGHYIFMNKVCNEKCKSGCPYKLKYILLIAIVFIAISFSLLFSYSNKVVRYGIVLCFFSILFIKKDSLVRVVKIFKRLK